MSPVRGGNPRYGARRGRPALRAAVAGAAAGAALVLAMAAPGAAEDGAIVLAGADEANGRALIAEHRCNGGCHQSHAEDNDPLTLYLREDRKIRNPQALVNMVQYCAIELELPFFPEDVTDIAAVLNREYYRFP